MAKGPYGNPLSTGIALNWEVDMTDYREDLKARKLEEAAKRKAQAKTKKAQADILKGITLDTSKVHERDRDQVSAMYAETIGDVMTLAETEQLGAIKVRQEKFERDIAPYITSLSSFNTYEGSDETKTYKDNQMARDWNDVDNITREEFFDKWGANVNLQKGAATFPVTNRIDLIGEINKRLQGVSKNVAYDSATGKPIEEGKLPTGSVIYKSEIDDPEGFIDGMTAWMLDQGMGAQYAVMGATGLKPEEFDEKTPTGTQKLAQYTRDYVANIAGPKLYGTKQERAAQPKTRYNYGFGNQNSIADVGFSSSPPSSVTRSYSTDAQKAKAVLDQAMVQLGENISTIDASVKMTDSREDFVMPTVLADLGFTKSVPTSFGDKVTISKGSVSKEFDPTATNFPQELRKFVETNTTDEDISSNTDVASHTSAAEKSTDKLLTPTTNTMVMDIAGGKTPKTVWGFKKGDRVILSGDNNAVEVVLSNDVSLQDGVFTGAGKYKDSGDVENTYYSLLFPVSYQSDEGLYSRFFNGDDDLNKFKKLNKGELPSMIKVAQNPSLKKTLLSLAQTRATAKVGGMSEAFLDEQMRINMTPLNNTSGQSASGSSTTNTPSFQ